MGGTCVIRGCVPKKLMVFASHYAHAAHEARDYGWDITLGDFNWPSFQARLHAELTRLESIYTRNANAAGVEIIAQRAVLKDANTIMLADGTTKTAEVILVATGGTPFVPSGIEGIEHAITSNEIFDLPALPKRLAVVGGGYIASEFACIFNGLGSEVTQLYRSEQILRGFDDEARAHISAEISRQGIDLRLKTDVTKIEKTTDGFVLTLTDGTTLTADAVLYATGRSPNTQGLGLETAGVDTGRSGEIIVDEFSQTSAPSVYAVGDVTNRVQLTPVAIREAVAFHETVINGTPMTPDHADIPSAIFTQPEYGAVGLTEEQAAKEGPVDVYATAFRPMQHAFIEKEERVLFKLIVARDTRKVIGCHIVAPHAGEMIQFAGIAVKAGLTKDDFDATVAVHPTMSEEIVLLKEPVRQHG